MSEQDSVLWASLGVPSQSVAERMLRLLIELGAQVVGAQEGSLLVVDAGGKDLVFAMTVHKSNENLLGQRVPIGKGVTGLAAQTHEVQIGTTVYKGVRQAQQWASETPDGQPTAVMAAPMLIDDELVGVITAVSFRADKRFTPDDATLYGRLAAVAGVVVDQHRRIQAFQAMRDGCEALAPCTDAERKERQIATAAVQLAKAHPDKLDQVAHLLSLIRELSSP